MSRKLLPVVLVSALAGGIAAVALVEVTGVGRGGGTSTTIVQQAPLGASTGPARTTADGAALTPRQLYERDAPGVVFIRAQVVQRTASPFDLGLPQEQQSTSTGSGFVIKGDGSILTNAHVIQGAVKVSVQFQDKKTVSARVVGKDVSSDLALLKVDPDGLDLTPLALGTSKEVQVGDPVIAIGNPFGLDRTLTTGVVSALQRRIDAPNGFQISNVIQTDAAINPGNSGGPLIDATGKVVGVNSQIATGGDGGGNVGIGFAVPIDTAREILPQLESSGRVDRAYLGVTSLTVDGSLDALNLPVRTGALVQSVAQDSPAAKAGLRGGDITAQLGGDEIQLGGDVIESIDGETVRSSDDVGRLVARKKPGDEVKIAVRRGDERRTVEVELGSRPNAALAG
ncbi:trypsin-like serine protease [Conexibacter sp. W3-3-2]|uniref:S1C family serine protease n=1 Tax=Conexibacter sp. W3-3-2 TaxID=2675227 RepID=UPI0012B9E96C|nr:trypsin-like peptidase domain-containing protein [Conexibacter sp. W3-3-2]MTD42843.1 trypsin-like serine protease [Conexibacter sp. W3-3-2]